MSGKKIGIICSDLHPLILKVADYVTAAGLKVEMVHWQSITYQDAQANTGDFTVLYLDRMGELTRSYPVQIKALELGSKARVINPPQAYWAARDKGLAAFYLRQAGIPIPRTNLCFNMATLSAQILDSQTYVAKSTLGCCGEDILVFSGGNAPKAQIENILQRDGMICLQEYIYNPERFIWRIDIVDDKVIVCNQRFSYVEGEHPICNGTQGGEVTFWHPSDLPASVRDVAVAAMKALGLKVGGVDIIPDHLGGLYVLEVNPEPDITLDRYEFPRAIADYLVSMTEGAYS